LDGSGFDGLLVELADMGDWNNPMDEQFPRELRVGSLSQLGPLKVVGFLGLMAFVGEG
jgi:hypothetical protein